MNVRVYSSDSRERVHAYGLALNIQNEILTDMTKMVSEMRVIGNKNLLPFQKGIIQSNNALKLLHDDLKERFGFKYILTYRLNQDVLENFFGVIRSKGGIHDHPDRQEFKYRLRSYILGYNEGALSENDNVSIDDTPDLVPEPTLTGSICSSVNRKNIQSSVECVEEHELKIMEYDGLENLAGYICHKLKDQLPDIRVNAENDVSYTWVNHLSKGGLSKPTQNMMDYMIKLEEIFNEANGETLLVTNNYLQKLLDLVQHIDCDIKIKKLFLRARMYFRIRKLNKEIVDNFKAKKRKYSKITT